MDSHTHLGIIVNNKGSLSDHIKNACRKGKNSFYALTDIGSPYLNPLSLSKLYKSVVLPSVLYGCELWNNMSTADSQRLKVFQHSICKSAQNLPRQTRSDMCESLFNVIPISVEIDARKLLFFGRLCRMSSQALPKQTFLIRLFSYLMRLTNNQVGFIPDVVQLLTIYNLIDYLHQWIENGSFPSKQSWKTFVRSATTRTHRDMRYLRMSSDPDFSRFLTIFNGRHPSSFWYIPNNCFEIRLCKFICKLITDQRRDSPDYCQLCGVCFLNLFTHIVCSCSITADIRGNWWNDITNNHCIDLSAELCGLTDKDLYCILLGRIPNTNLDPCELEVFQIKNFKFLSNATATYQRYIRHLPVMAN